MLTIIIAGSNQAPSIAMATITDSALSLWLAARQILS